MHMTDDEVDTADHRPDAYWEWDDDFAFDRAILRASSLGSPCTAALVRSLIGQPEAPAPDWMMGKYREGVAAEPIILGIMEERWGWKPQTGDVLKSFGEVDETGQLLLELEVGKHRVRCHPDGVAVKLDRPRDGDEAAPEWATVGAYAVVEIKALAASTYEKFKADGWGLPQYKWQVAIEMLTTGLPALVIVGVKDKDGGIEDVHVKYVTEPPVSRVDVMKRVLAVVKAAGNAEMGLGVGDCETKRFPCPHYRNGGLCGESAAKVDDDDLAKREGGAEARRLAWKAANARKEMDKWRGREADYKAQLIEYLDTTSLPTGRYGPYKVAVSTPKTGRVSWKEVAVELRGDLADDEWKLVQDEARGAVPAPSVTVKEIEDE